MRKIIPILIFVCFCFACTNNKQNADNAGNDTINSEALIGAEPFSEFIEKFHKDSLFAMTRVEEKTEGFNSDLIVYDSIEGYVGGEYTWSKNEMRDELYLCKILRKDKNYKVDFEVKADSALEHIYIPETGSVTYIKFKLKSKKWYLVEYESNNL